MRDAGIIAMSVVIAIMLVKTGVLKDVLITNAHEWRFLSSVLAGMFFVSVFTAAPAAVVLVAIAQAVPVWEVALFGAVGAFIYDMD
ncbi:MAG: hypothetical protein AAB581_04280, partial [Patescibacteria group bacterium]